MIVKQIEFYLENCEVITIPGYYIGDIVADEIKTRICRTACNDVSKFDICEVFGVEIHADANKEEYRPFGAKFGSQGPRTKFDRLHEYDDITAIRIKLTDNDYWDPTLDEETEEYCIYPKWIGNSDCENAAQDSILTEDGHLYIMIAAENTKYDELFADAPYNAEERESKFRMYDIGDENHQKHLARHNIMTDYRECPKSIWD